MSIKIFCTLILMLEVIISTTCGHTLHVKIVSQLPRKPILILITFLMQQFMIQVTSYIEKVNKSLTQQLT